ncbi:MAG: ribonuclease HII [Erysipelotrichaceae bacterium]
MAKTRLEYEEKYWKLGYQILGIDEAGRGPLCGPVVVVGVCLNEGYYNETINDSKKLNTQTRNLLFEEIKRNSLYYIEVIEPSEIDKYNIYQATKRGFQRIANKFDGFILTDCMPLEDKQHESLIKGDSKSMSIAAASIIAKVTRDNIMLEYDKLYPAYEFAKHKGYPTKRHLELLKIHGVLPFYRFSYKPVRELTEIKLF